MDSARISGRNGRRFSLGHIVATPAALVALDMAGLSVGRILERHQRGDWGDLCEEDWAANERALPDGERLFSAYQLCGGATVYVITEWHGVATTVLLASEY